MRRRDREITDEKKINEIIRKSKICRVGFHDNGEVYIVPLNFGFAEENGKRVFYFHSAKEGRKVDLARQNPKVGFEIDAGFEFRETVLACECSAGFQSVIGTGTIGMVETLEDKRAALLEIMTALTGKRNWEFEEKMVEAVAVLRLEVEEISCKEHM